MEDGDVAPFEFEVNGIDSFDLKETCTNQQRRFEHSCSSM